MTTTIVTCSRCGLNVPNPTTTYSRQGDLLCRNCSDRDGMKQTIDRARQAYAMGDHRPLRLFGIWGRLGLFVAFFSNKVLSKVAPMQRQIDRIENQVAKEVSFNAANADAVNFTCKPCGKSLPLEEGAYNPIHRLLCKTCFAVDTEARRKAYRKQLMVQRVQLLILAVLVLVAVGAVIGFYLKEK